MGTDNLFQKRRAKGPRDFKRRKPKYAPYDRVLIVCEGTKTEPNYFGELRDYYTLETANVRISGECGSDPMSVVQHGKDLYRNEQQKGDAYDRVYCVFDGDVALAKYEEALSAIASAKPSGAFFSTTSIPCFEYWFLLHFVYTTAPFTAVGGISACNAIETKLRQHWNGYKKGMKGTFLHLLDNIETAKIHAAHALAEAKRNDTDNPSTHVHTLVSYLQSIRN